MVTFFRLFSSFSTSKALKSCRFSMATAAFSNREMPVEYLDLSKTSGRIAYRTFVGKKSPGIVFFNEFMTNMKAVKPTVLQRFCEENGHSFISFDYEAVGESPGEIEDMTIGRWKQNCLSVLDKLTTGPQIIIGSSMGSWLMFLIARERPERLHGLLGVSSAINVTTKIYESFPEEIRKRIHSGMTVTIPGPYGDYIMTKQLLDESKQNFIPITQPLPVKCPLRLIHSIHDKEVPFKTSILLAKLVESLDVEVTLRKNATHQMSDPESIDLMLAKLKELLAINA